MNLGLVKADVKRPRIEPRRLAALRSRSRRRRKPAIPAKWQVMETAPKDGTEILLCWVRPHPTLVDHYAVASWWPHWYKKNEGAWVIDSDFAVKVWEDDGVHEFPPIYKRPTHWMPLPEPPELVIQD